MSNDRPVKFVRIHGRVVPIHGGPSNRVVGAVKAIGGAGIASLGGAAIAVSETEAAFKQAHGKQLFRKGYEAAKQFRILGNWPQYEFATKHANAQLRMGAMHRVQGALIRKAGFYAGGALLLGGSALFAKGLFQATSKKEKSQLGLNKTTVIAGGTAALGIGAYTYGTGTGKTFKASREVMKSAMGVVAGKLAPVLKYAAKFK